MARRLAATRAALQLSQVDGGHFRVVAIRQYRTRGLLPGLGANHERLTRRTGKGGPGPGQRVLLIDADMRRPKAHEFFGVSQEPGLSNVMVGDAKASEAVKRTLTPNLWLMTSGKHPPNPAELLGSRRFKDFMASLGEHFDWVILDSPPVMAVTDASVIAHSATGVVFVVGAEMTSKGAAKAALEQLDSAKAKYVGGILNRVDVRRNPYYYARHYRREYQNYYSKAGA